MVKKEILTALSLLSLLMIMVHLKNEPPLPHEDFNEPELEFSEFEIQENVKKDTVFEDYPRFKNPTVKSGLKSMASTSIHKVIRTLHTNEMLNTLSLSKSFKELNQVE